MKLNAERMIAILKRKVNGISGLEFRVYKDRCMMQDTGCRIKD
jgi:hypothetical protein